MRDLTRYAGYELRELQGRALMEMLDACDAATHLTRQLTSLPAAEGDLYRRLVTTWHVKIAEAQRWGDLIPRITAELERRAQAARTGRVPS